MNVENIYKFAAQHKLKFPFKGAISTEDLFDLNMKDLDSVYKALSKQAKDSEEDSLMATASTEDTVLAVKIEIVKDIFNQKQAELQARKDAADKKAYNEKIAAILADKENEELRSKSADELRSMLKQ